MKTGRKVCHLNGAILYNASREGTHYLDTIAYNTASELTVAYL